MCITLTKSHAFEQFSSKACDIVTFENVSRAGACPTPLSRMGPEFDMRPDIQCANISHDARRMRHLLLEVGLSPEMSETKSLSEVAVLIVGYKNASDIVCCLKALSRSAASPQFDIFICENGGRSAYDALIRSLVEDCVCREITEAVEGPDPTFLSTRRLELISRRSRVVVGCARDNFGYGGGVNAWLRRLGGCDWWKGAWILNPDTEPAPNALRALVARAEAGGKGMVGSTILEAGSGEVIRFRGGIRWQKMLTRSVAIGLGESIHAPIDLCVVERAMDSPSGASMYVTRRCIEEIGLMDESFFLFFEDLDWGMRAKKLGLGYASDSIVAHRRGTTTGSAGHGSGFSRLSVYLQNRNAVHFVRRYFPWALPVRVAASAYEACRFLVKGAPSNFMAALAGLGAGLRGELGAPSWHRTPQ